MNNILVYIGVAVIIFLIFREVLTWYWKINKIVNLLEQIEKNTRINEIKEEPLAGSVSEYKTTGSVWRDGKWESK